MKMCGSLKIDASFKEDEESTMVAEFVGWSDFPKGLRVLLLSDDDTSAAEIKSKLEEMDYIVSLFRNEDEASEAAVNRTESFHVAIMEVNTSGSHEAFGFLQMARSLPTIMVSNGQCLSTMMKCIALGAAEFLQKPLSEDKLRNIWQHVVHKAFNSGENALSKSLKPVKETIASMLRIESDTRGSGIENQQNPYEDSDVHDSKEREHENQMASEGLTAPLAPRTDHTISSVEQECRVPSKDCGDSGEQIFSGAESESVDNMCFNSIDKRNPMEEELISVSRKAIAEQEVDSAGRAKTDVLFSSKDCNTPSSSLDEGVNTEPSISNPIKRNAHVRGSAGSNTSNSDKKKMKASKVDWTPELHMRFVQAVEQLGIDQAIPSKILGLMKVADLTRHNVASHLQKYRMQRKHVFPRDDGGRWPQHRESKSRVYGRKSLLAFPPVRSNYGYPPNQGFSVWGHPSGIQMWSHTGHHTWQPSSRIWPWKTFTRMHADAWGCPAVPQENLFSIQVNHSLPRNHFSDRHVPMNLYDFHVEEEVVDAVVKEAISKPWLPLPLGLKPPSTDTVLAELQRQGIQTIPPHSSSCRCHMASSTS